MEMLYEPPVTYPRTVSKEVTLRFGQRTTIRYTAHAAWEDPETDEYKLRQGIRRKQRIVQKDWSFCCVGTVFRQCKKDGRLPQRFSRDRIKKFAEAFAREQRRQRDREERFFANRH